MKTITLTLEQGIGGWFAVVRRPDGSMNSAGRETLADAESIGHVMLHDAIMEAEK